MIQVKSEIEPILNNLCDRKLLIDKNSLRNIVIKDYNTNAWLFDFHDLKYKNRYTNKEREYIIREIKDRLNFAENRIIEKCKILKKLENKKKELERIIQENSDVTITTHYGVNVTKKPFSISISNFSKTVTISDTFDIELDKYNRLVNIAKTVHRLKNEILDLNQQL